MKIDFRGTDMRATAFTFWYREKGEYPIDKTLRYPGERTKDITEADIIRMKECLKGI
jgi:hypothetical protein